MAEVLAVLAVISVLAAVATPGFVGMMRDRRAASETGMFTDAFRQARARALGRGAAVRVEVRPSDGDIPAALILQEHVSAVDLAGMPTADALPVPGCDADGEWRVVETFLGRPRSTNLVVHRHDDGSVAGLGTGPTERVALYVCYTPRGRTMVNYPVSGTVGHTTLDGVAYLETTPFDPAGGPARRILILPNGLTRMRL